MLVLSRHIHEGFVITDATGNVLLEITVTEFTAGKVKIGFTADRSINIDRNEVWKAKMLSKTSVELTEPGSSDSI